MRLAGMQVARPLHGRHQLHHALQGEHDDQQRQQGGARSVQQE